MSEAGGGFIDRAWRRVLGTVDRVQLRVRPLAVGVATIKKYGEDGGANLAALIAYWSFFSLFPLLLVLVSVLEIVLADNADLRANLLSSVLSQFPVVGDQIAANVGNPSEVAASRGGGTLGLLVGMVAALWAGLGAVAALQTAMNEVWNVHPTERPAWWWVRLRGLAVLGVLGVFIAASTAMSALGSVVQSAGFSGRVLSIVGAGVLSTAGFVAAFRLLTKRPLAWSELWPGAVFAGLGVVVLQQLGTWYLTRVVELAGRVYGVFAVVIGLLTWLYLLSQLTVYAAELNTVLADRRWPRRLADDPSPAPEEPSHR